jgi:CheY-like chemotaxis protein
MPSTTVATEKTVLVADDTAFVRDRFRTALEGAGHRAVTVGTGLELLATVRKQLERIDLEGPAVHDSRRGGAVRHRRFRPVAFLFEPESVRVRLKADATRAVRRVRL